MTQELPPPQAEPSATATIVLGPVRIDAAGKRLFAGDVRLEADASQVELLLSLVRAYPGIVAKEALIAQVWGGPYVTEAALQKSVSTLRRTLREHGLPENTIETRHRRGYQLTVAPEWPDHPEAAAVSPQIRAPGAVSRVAMGRLLAALLLILACLAVIWWAPWQDETMPPPPKRVDSVQDDHTERLAALADADLIDTIKSAFSDDPPFAAAAIAELRRRAGTDPERRGEAALAEKFEGILAYRAGRFDAAEDWYQRALAQFRAIGNRAEEANVLNNLAILQSESGRDPRAAEQRYRESLAIRESLGDAGAVMASQRNLANLLLEHGPLDRAETAVQAYADAATRIGSPTDRVEAGILRGDIARARGTDPRPGYRAALELAGTLGLPAQAASAWQRIGREELRVDRAEEAIQAFEQAIALYAQGDPGHQLPWLKYNLAEALAAAGRIDAALAAYTEVLALPDDLAGSTLAVDARINAARLHSQRGELDAARSLLDGAARHARLLDNPFAEVAVQLARADFALRTDQIVAARGQIEAARRSLANQEHHELTLGLRFISAYTAMAEGRLAQATAELDALESMASVQSDARVAPRLQRARAVLDLLAGRFSSAYAALDTVAESVDSPGATPSEPEPGSASPWLWLLAGLCAGGVLAGGFVRGRRS